MRTTLYRMVVFATVCREGSFTRAAKSLGTTKSAVSQHIRDLEEALHTKILHRNARRVSVTEPGQRYLTYCQSILNTYEQSQRAMQEEVDGVHDTLVLTAPHALIDTWVNPALKTYLSENPHARVELYTDDKRLHLVEDRIDLALRVGRLPDSSEQAQRLGHTDEILCVHPVYLAQQNGVPKSLNELEAWDHIASSWQIDPITYQAKLPRAKSLQSGKFTPRIKTLSLTTTLSMLRAGLGVALVPEISVREDLAEHRLVRLLSNHNFGQSPIHALHAFGRMAPIKIRRFIACLKACKL